jgi:hypothetical protein
METFIADVIPRQIAGKLGSGAAHIPLLENPLARLLQVRRRPRIEKERERERGGGG